MQKAFIVHDATDNSALAVGSDRFVSAHVGSRGEYYITFETCDLKDGELSFGDCTMEIKESPEQVAKLLNQLS